MRTAATDEEIAEVEQKIISAADRVWDGLHARVELCELIREWKDEPRLGPTRITALSDHLYRPEHVSRVASGPPPKKPKQRIPFKRNGS